MIKKIILHPFFIFPLLTCIVFWPISLTIFTFKNDVLTYYYPVRTLISDAINNYELPLWTPYINMGYPLHADLQSGAWNPVIWIIAFLTHYSLAAFHFEQIVYLAFGGIGCYYLGRDHGWSRSTAYLIGIAYTCSGPVIDSLQFTAFISATCYIPYVILFSRRMFKLQQPLLNALYTALFLYFLFTGGYPAMFIITIYLLAALLIYSLFTTPKKMEYVKKLGPALLVLSVAFILISLPAILSFIQYLPLIGRGQKQGLDFVLENSMPPACLISLISPFSTTATHSFFNTNLLMRNAYIGFVPLVLVIYSISSKALRNHSTVRFYWIMTLLMFGLAWGDYFFLRQLAYYTLPLMNTFRHPALFRFFGVIFLLLLAGIALNEMEQRTDKNKLKKIIVILGGVILLVGLFFGLSSSAKLFYDGFTLDQLKNLLPTLGFQQRFLIQLPFLLITTGIFYWLVSGNKASWQLLLLSTADIFFATQLNIPVTVIGARNFKATERLLNRNPLPFPLPGKELIEQNVLHSLDSTYTFGSSLPYEKRIGRNDYFITPGNLLLQDAFYESPLRATIFKNPVVYFAERLVPAEQADNSLPIAAGVAVIPAEILVNTGAATSQDSVVVELLSANRMKCLTNTVNPRLLVYLQNYYPGWKVFIDGTPQTVFTVNTSFMAVNIPAGKHEVLFKYYPTSIRNAWYVSLLSLLVVMVLVLRSVSRRFCFLKQQEERNTKREVHPF